MALDLTAVRQAVVDAVSAVPLVVTRAFVPDQAPVGAADVVVVAPSHVGNYVDYWESFSPPLAAIHLRLIVITAAQSDRDAQQRLDALLSSGTGMTRSLIDAVMADQTLGGVVDTLILHSATAPYQLLIADVRYLAVDLELEIHQRRN